MCSAHAQRAQAASPTSTPSAVSNPLVAMSRVMLRRGGATGQPGLRRGQGGVCAHRRRILVGCRMPGVSKNACRADESSGVGGRGRMWARRGTSCTLPVVRTPSVSRLVVCAFDVAMETFCPTSALSSVDCGQQRAPPQSRDQGRRRDSGDGAPCPRWAGPAAPPRATAPPDRPRTGRCCRCRCCRRCCCRRGAAATAPLGRRGGVRSRTAARGGPGLRPGSRTPPI